GLTGQLVPMGNTLAIHVTMTSFVVDVDNHKIYLANGTAPVSQNQYISFPMIENFNPATFAQESSEVYDNNSFAKQHPLLAQAEQLFIQSKKAYEDELDSAKSLRLMERVILLSGDNQNYSLIQGILALKNNNDIIAKMALNHVISLGNTHRALVANFYL